MGKDLKTIVLASRNQGKLKEIRAMVSDIDICLSSLGEYPYIPEILEDGESFLENALIKGRAVAQATGEIALADDSGLEVEALGGAPGIHSARYAGDGADDIKNNQKLLNELKRVNAVNRNAAFYCLLALCWPGGGYEIFEGRWEGIIAEEPAGDGGFGYDPIFFLRDEGVTVAQLSPETKNRISHRARAFAKFKERLING